MARTQPHHHTMPGWLHHRKPNDILTQEIQNGLQMNKDTIAVFVDLEKSYDKVGMQGLFIKMRDVGMYSNMYRRIKNLLTDRTIATQTESHKQDRHQGRDTARELTRCEVPPRHACSSLCRCRSARLEWSASRPNGATN